jgi:hypothetical protein
MGGSAGEQLAGVEAQRQGARVASGEVGLKHARVHARVQWTRASRVNETLLGGRSMERRRN